MPKDLTFSTQVGGERNSQFEAAGVPLLQLIDEADFVGTLFLSSPAANQQMMKKLSMPC